MESSRHSDLDVETDRSFQEKFWIAERIGWLLMALLVATAAVGLTGRGGPFAHRTVTVGDASIEYPRISRWQSADDVSVTFPASARGKAQVLLPSAFTNVFSIESAAPQPTQVVATPDGLRFTFDIGDSPGAKKVAFNVRASRPAWWTSGQARIGNGSTELGFLVLP